MADNVTVARSSAAAHILAAWTSESSRSTGDREGDFLALMERDEHGGQCWCSAWWVPTWEAYVDQTAEERRAVRDGVFGRDVHDGYLAYVAGAPVGWMQAWPA